MIVLGLIFIIAMTSIKSVNADMGPKPELRIIVLNPPEGEYYLDLLVDYEVNNGYTRFHEENYNPDKIIF